MVVVFIDMMKCMAASRKYFRRQLIQMRDQSIAGKQQRITYQTTYNEEKVVYVGSP